MSVSFRLVVCSIAPVDNSWSVLNPRNWNFYTKFLFPLIREQWLLFCYSIDINTSFLDIYFVNYYKKGYHCMQYHELNNLMENNKDSVVFVTIANFCTYYLDIFFYIEDYNKLSVKLCLINIILLGYSWPVLYNIFYILIISMAIITFGYEDSRVVEKTRSDIALFYQFILHDYLTMIISKYESVEEALCSIVLWPWCFLLVFTHAFFYENNEIMFMFIEWGLPVLYGSLLLLEHFWNFGVHIFVYLNGGRGRRSFFLTLIEDVLSFFIVIVRISLQVVRGLLCGFMHNLFRELNDKLIDIFEIYEYYNDWDIPFFRYGIIIDSINFICNWYLISLMLLFVYSILFLQLLFLLIAVWLFCRCWFISSSYEDYEYLHNDYEANIKSGLINKKRDLNLKKNYKIKFV